MAIGGGGVGGEPAPTTTASVTATKLLAALSYATEARDADAARNAATKLARAAAKNAQTRDALAGTRAKASLLVAGLKQAPDERVAEELIAGVASVVQAGKKQARRLAKAGLASVVSRGLGRHGLRTDAAVANGFEALLAIAPHEKKLGTSLRLGGGLGVLLLYVKQKKSEAESLSTPLRLLTVAAKNKQSAQQVTSANGVALLLGLVKTHAPLRRGSPAVPPALRALAQLATTLSSANTQMISRGGVKLALQVFCGWAAQPDAPGAAALEMRAASLALLKSATSSSAGRDALLKAGGVRQLLTEARRLASHGQEKNALLSMAVLILKRFLPKIKVPAPTNARKFEVQAPLGPRLLPPAPSEPEGADEADFDDATTGATDPTGVTGLAEQWPALADLAIAEMSQNDMGSEVAAALRWLEDEWDPAMAEDALTLNSAEDAVATRFVQELSMMEQSSDDVVEPEDLTARLIFENGNNGGPTYNTHLPPIRNEPFYQSAADEKRNLLLDDLAALEEENELSTIRKPELLYDVNDPKVAEVAAAKGILPSFDSCFESGNLRQAFRTHDYSFSLTLNSDINATGHHQWFYFRLEGVEPGREYKFDIINLQKPGSQFQQGMLPVVYSSSFDGWCRMGQRTAYYKNANTRTTGKAKGSTTRNYYTLSFSITFPANEAYYVAYHFPFTYSDLQLHLSRLVQASRGHQQLQRQLLCRTLAGNRCDLLTVTSWAKGDLEISPLRGRPYIVLTARVHPGETNSSWMMKGLLDFLLSDEDEACRLRRRYIFKIVPMLNPDGVAHGSHRCSLSGMDLNRHWDAPDIAQHPTIYYTKLLIRKLRAANRLPLLYCDFHGHSRKKNVFLYGCREAGVVGPEQALVDVLSRQAPLFSSADCRFGVEKSKLSTSRVVVWSMGVTCSYTMEATYNGASRGIYDGVQVTTAQLEEMGRYFIASVPGLEAQMQLYGGNLQSLAMPRHSFSISKLPRTQAVDDDDDDDEEEDEDEDLPTVPEVEIRVAGRVSHRNSYNYAAAAALGRTYRLADELEEANIFEDGRGGRRSTGSKGAETGNDDGEDNENGVNVPDADQAPGDNGDEDDEEEGEDLDQDEEDCEDEVDDES